MANVVPAGAGKQSKYILRQFPLIRFYAALALSLVYFVIQLVVAHVAHSLILQIDAYHMLYNIFALAVCIITAKVSKKGNNLKNTFGWRRIDVCGAVANLCFLSALGFSVVVECIQSIVHAAHHQAMHLPVLVGVTGVIGLFVNLIIFFLIGGYTLHQSGFLCSSKEKEGRGEESVISEGMRRGPYKHVMRERQGAFELFRDFFGCCLVVVVSFLVYYWGQDKYTEYVDPGVTIMTVFILGATSYRYAMEAGEILLLTIPSNMDVAELQSQLKKKFTEVCDIHEFHVWQLTPARIIASLHIVLQKPHGYLSIQNKIIHFLHESGISHVTLQPEFLQLNEDVNTDALETLPMGKCFIPCRGADDDDFHCNDMQCCPDEDEHDHDHDDDDDGHGHSHSHGRGRSSSQFECSSFNSFSNVQSLSSVGGGVIASGSRLKSESLNNHLDMSLDSINISNRKDSHGGAAATSLNTSNNGSGIGGAILGGDTDTDEEDDEQGRAELRPMI